MYNISKLSGESKVFLQNLPLVTKNNQDITVMSLAKAIANELTMPSGEVENSSEFYLQTTYITVREIASIINELVIIDLNRLQELVKMFWLVRYNVLFPRKKLFTLSSLITESYFLGYGSLLSTDIITFIQVNSGLLVTVTNGFSQLFSEINVSENELEAV